jgi:acrylyl-CoA reductase (NADPH)
MVFRAFVVTRAGDSLTASLGDVGESDLMAGEVLIGVRWSAINYKDAMVTRPGNRVARISPLVPGVDLAGVVLESSVPAWAAGAEVLVHGYDLGVAHHGGFAERARVPADWVVPLPGGLSARQAMVIGTAGFTAVLSLRRLHQAGLTPTAGPVLVTGASGGVGSMAVALLARQGFEVTASTGKHHEHDYLRQLGASEVIGRDDVIVEDGRVLGPERWAAAVDCVGGATLAAVLRTLRYGAPVAASGLTGGSALETTVYPFIVRNVVLAGVDTVATPIAQRRAIWADMAQAFPPETLEDMVAGEVGLKALGDALSEVAAGRVRGRILVRPDH